jgi:two-component system LytT family response regulator
LESGEKIRIVIADDEPLAREGLADLLAEKQGVEIVGRAENGIEAIEAIRNLDPDLVFLDIQMPGKTGIEVVQEVGAENMPAVVFVTAYDQYALKAFDLAAIDYLLKPFDQERFDHAFERAQDVIALRELQGLRSRLANLLHGRTRPTPADTEKKGYLERIAVEMRGQIRVVSVDQIDYIAASGSYAELHVDSETYLIRERMQTLEERLDPRFFFRIHRGIIARLDRIDTILFNAGGNYAVRLKDGTRLKLGRSRREELEQRLGLDALG